MTEESSDDDCFHTHHLPWRSQSMQVIIFIYTDIILLELNSLISHLDRKLSQSPRPYGFQRKRREKGTDSASHPPHYAPSWTIK